MPGGERALLADLASHAGLLVHNAVLAEQLAERVQNLTERANQLGTARRRLVAAQDRERRRIERDLHDGAQQTLVAVMLGMRMAAAQQAPTSESAPERATPAPPSKSPPPSTRKPPSPHRWQAGWCRRWCPARWRHSLRQRRDCRCRNRPCHPSPNPPRPRAAGRSPPASSATSRSPCRSPGRPATC